MHMYSPKNSAHFSTNHTLSLTVRAHFEEPLLQILIRRTQLFIRRGTDGIAQQPYMFSLVDPSVPSCECSHGQISGAYQYIIRRRKGWMTYRMAVPSQKRRRSVIWITHVSSPCIFKKYAAPFIKILERVCET